MISKSGLSFSMRKTVVSGLVRIAGDTSPAANEDRIVQGFERNSPIADGQPTAAAGGWDPYDVWRTRVKKARDPKRSDVK